MCNDGVFYSVVLHCVMMVCSIVRSCSEERRCVELYVLVYCTVHLCVITVFLIVFYCSV